MDIGELKKITQPKAAELVAGSAIEENVAPLLDDDPDAKTLVTRLVDNSMFLDAARFIVLALPPRETTWLGCLTARYAAEEKPLSPVDKGALESAERWVYEPSEENRRAAERAIQDADYTTPAALAALSAFYSGGNIADDDDNPLDAPNGVSAKLVDAATALVSVGPDEPAMETRARRLLAQALDVADGGSGRDVNS